MEEVLHLQFSPRTRAMFSLPVMYSIEMHLYHLLAHRKLKTGLRAAYGTGKSIMDRKLGNRWRIYSW